MNRRRLVALFAASLAVGAAPPPAPSPAPALRDGQHDFDFEIGRWHTDLRRLRHPLSGATEWLHYQGTTLVRKVWGGRANLVELEVDGPTGRFEALSLRLYDPQAHQWSLNYANAASGTLSSPPSIGALSGIGYGPGSLSSA